jgi:hypothetical protein
LALLSSARLTKKPCLFAVAGFSDISHFNRLFRSRFGDTP